MVTVTIAKAYTGAGTVSVVTQGSSTLDYALVAPTVPVVGSCAATLVFVAGNTCTVQYTFAPTRPFTRYGAASVFDGSGNLLGNAFLTGLGTGPQVSYPLNAASVFTVVGSGFSTPYGVAVDAAGNVYFANAVSGAVKEILASNASVVTLGSGFSAPAAIAVDGAGNVYVADAGNHAVKEIVAVSGTPGSTIVVLSNAFTNPQGVAVDGAGNVYVADAGAAAVDELPAVNGIVAAGTTPVPLGVANSFTAPNGVAVDASGNLYVTDNSKTSVRKLAAPVSATSTVVALGTGLVNPQGVAVDGSGNLYVADLGNNAIKEFLAVGGSVQTGTIAIVQLGTGYSTPSGVAVDASGDVFVADGGNNQVEELNDTTPPSLTFTSSTVLGSTSTDSPRTFTLSNSGNAALTFPVPGSGFNPGLSASFGVGTGNTCPVVASGGSSGSLAAGSSCVDSVNFTPVMAGTVTGSLVSTDTNLNATAATQTVALSGTATAGTVTVTVAPPSVAANSAVVNSPSVTLAASVAFAGVPPTGAVTFSVNSGASLTATCTGTSSPLSCKYTYNPSSLTVASYTLSAAFAGDSNYSSASSAAGSGSLTITQGTPTISLAPGGSSVVDNSVTFTVTVTAPTSGITPVGPVSFSAVVGGKTTVLCSAAALSGGTASCPTTALSAGSNSVTATLAADTNFISATSNTVMQAVSAAPTTVAVSSAGSSTVDSSVTLTATVSGTAAFTLNPSGTVSFSANGAAISTCTAQPLSTSNHTATCSATNLIAPSDSITATYNGDSNFSASPASPPYAQSMAKDNSGASVVSNLPSGSVVNQTVTFTATVTPTNNSTAGVIPTGSVTFTKGAGGATLCSGPVVVASGTNGTGTAACATAISAATSSPTNLFIFATYNGDTNFNVSAASSVGQLVNAANTTTSVTSSPNPAAVNGTVMITPSVVPANTGVNYPGTALPNGTIAVFDSGVSTTSPICSSPVANGVASACVNSTATPIVFQTSGPHTLYGVFTPTDSNFVTSQSANYTQSVSTSGLTLTVSNPSSSPLTVNQSATFAATFPTFSTGNALPAGTVAYYDSLVSSTVPISGCSALTVIVNTPAATATIPNCRDALLVAGTHVISAIYTPSGTSSFQTTYSNQFPQVVAQSATTAAISAFAAGISVDQTVAFNATVTPTVQGATLPTGTVAFTAVLGGVTSTLCTATLAATGGTSASCQAPFLAPGSYTINAKYSGDTNFAASSLATLAETVAATGTSISVPSGFGQSSAPAVNQPSLYSVQLMLPTGIYFYTPGYAVPTGNVTFKDSVTNVSCTGALSVLGSQSLVASCTLSEPTAGAHTITVTYVSGDANFVGSSTSAAETIALNGTAIAAASISTNPSSPAVDQSGVVLNATIVPTYTGAALPGGSVTFSDAATGTATTTCVSAVTSGVVAPCSHVFTSQGTHTITAAYGGDTNFSPISQTNTITVGGAGAISLNLTSTTPSITVNQSATYAAAFSPVQTGPTYPAGSVQFYDGATALTGTGCNQAVSSTGTIASCSEVMTTAGTHVISALYTSSNSNFGPTITSGNLAQVVALNTTTTALKSPAASSTFTTDQVVTFTATVTPTTLTPAATGTTVPIGTLSFAATNTTSGVSTALCASAVATAAGVTSATCPAPLLAAGTYTVTATYSGDNINFQTSAASAPVTVAKTSTTVGLVTGSTLSSPASPLTNQSAAYSVQIVPSVSDAGLTTPTGNVVFTDSATSATCTAVVLASTGVATCSFADTVTGAHTIAASYLGDNNFSTSSQSFPITIGSTTTTLSISENPSTIVVSQVPATLNATITAANTGSALPTGTVIFTDAAGGTSSTCQSPVASGVVAPCTHVFTTAGVHSLTAVYSGDNNFTTITQTASFTVGKATPQVSVVSSVPTSVATQAVTFSATVTPPYTGVNPSGSIAFTSSPSSTVFSGCTAVAVTATSGIATATCTVTFPQTASGTFAVTATYSGDTNYITAASTSGSQNTQNIQNFTASIAPATLVIAQGNTNLTDPYLPTSITYTQAAVNTFVDPTTSVCTTAVAGLTCAVTPANISNGAGTASIVVTASLAVTPGIYPITVTTSDTAVGHTSLSQAVSTSVTVISRAFPSGTIPYSVQTAGTASLSFTVLPSFAGSTYTCNPKVANLDPAGSGNYLLGSDTLINLHLACSAITAGSGGNTYNFTITAGSGAFAGLKPAPVRPSANRILAAGLFAPILLAFGFSRRAKKARKALLRSLAIALLTLAALQATTGCGGGFTGDAPAQTAVVGSYLIGINNAQGITVAEIPLVVAGNQ